MHPSATPFVGEESAIPLEMFEKLVQEKAGKSEPAATEPPSTAK